MFSIQLQAERGAQLPASCSAKTAMRSWMRTRGPLSIAALIVAATVFVTHTADAYFETATADPDLSQISSPKSADSKSPQAGHLAKEQRRPYPDSYWEELSDRDVWRQYQAAVDKLEEDRLWEARYLIYQELISRSSAPLLFSDLGFFELGDGTPICLLHGRTDVLDNAETIRAVTDEYPRIPAIMVAAAIAEQASDVERIFGVDILEKAILSLPGRENMCIGIAQLRPTEAMSLGLGLADLFRPEAAVRGMCAKLNSANEHIDLLRDQTTPISPTDRYMLLSLAQNNLGSIDDYNRVGGDWDKLLRMHNYARVMRYFLIHLDWLVANGWKPPDGVDLDQWRRIAFSSAREGVIPPLRRRS